FDWDGDILIIYHPWYDRIMKWVERLRKVIELGSAFSVNGLGVEEIFGEILVKIENADLKINLSVFALAYILAHKLAGKIVDRVYEGFQMTGEFGVVGYQ
ncbi:hypothetical protein ACERIT_05065, partial [Halopenitus sp. H-Gu1]|uniref:hypothetical protein n=1 Tax=Halopenitus sp. H-Gu1 TaxID=3242697 RepID=UPI00359EFAC4